MLVEAVGTECTNKSEIAPALLRHRHLEWMSSWCPGFSGMHPTAESGFVKVDEWSSAVDYLCELTGKVYPLSPFQLGVGIFPVEFVQSIDPLHLVFLVEIVQPSSFNCDVVAFLEESNAFS